MQKREQSDVYRYFQFEKTNNLFDYKYKGVNFWILIRCWDIYLQIAGYPSINRQGEKKATGYMQELLFNIRKCIELLFFLIKKPKGDLLVSGSSALRKGIDGEEIYQYFPFLDKQNTFTYVFHNVNVKDKTKEQGLNHSFINLVVAFLKIVAKLKRKVTGYRDENCKRIVKLLQEEFEVDITHSEFERVVEESVLQYKVARWYYSKVLHKIKCKMILMEPGYATEHFALAEVAHRMRIPIAEMQHGILNSTHPAYNYAEWEKEYFCLPDYIFTWGEVWSNMIHMPSGVKIVTCGYPYFDLNRSSVKDIKEEKYNITFFTNLYTEKLVDIALELEKIDVENKLNITVKFHPYLQYDWELNRDKFKESGINVIHDASCNIYELIAKTRYCVGYSSTVLFETVAMGKLTYAMQVDGKVSKDLEGLEDSLLPISNALELYDSISIDENNTIVDKAVRIMMNNAETNIMNEIKRIVR